MNKLYHNQHFMSALIILDSGISLTISDTIVWIDQECYYFAKYGDNLPYLTIEVDKMKNHFIKPSATNTWESVIVL